SWPRPAVGSEGKGDLDRGRVVIPGRRRPPADAVARPDARRRPRVHGPGSMDGRLPRTRGHARRSGFQHARRRLTRLARSPARRGALTFTSRDRVRPVARGGTLITGAVSRVLPCLGRMDLKRSIVAGALLAAAGCAQVPTRPTVMAVPGRGKARAEFQP